MIAKFGRPPKLWFSGRATLAEQVVNKHGAMRNEAIVSNRYELADERVGLNSAPLADICSLLYLYKWPYKCSITNCAPIEIDWLHHRDVLAEYYIDNPCMPNFWLHHKRVA